MERTELIKGSATLFEANKKLEKVYATSDGQYFVKKGHADSQAAKLKTATIEITRNEFEGAEKKTSKKA